MRILNKSVLMEVLVKNNESMAGRGVYFHDWSLLIADTYRMRDRIQISFCLAIKPSPALANQPKL